MTTAGSARRRVLLLFGGRSAEHDVSRATAVAVASALDPSRYEVVPVAITTDGQWLLADEAVAQLEGGRRALPAAFAVAGSPVDPPSSPGRDASVTHLSGGAPTPLAVDVVLPLLHGPYGEDGTVQGLLELANVPYVGAGVLGSAVGMDKAVMKTLFIARGLPVAPYLVVVRPEWHRDAAGLSRRVETELRFPVSVKPANLGSSVGISKAKNAAEFGDAMTLALQYDRKIVIEAAVPNAREIECAVLGNDDPQASIPGEIIPLREFYDYEAKYMDANGSRLEIPAALSEHEAAEIRRMSIEAFRACDLSGLARVDFLMSRDTGHIFVNEVNTLPGFTTISMYPKLWEATGVPYPELLDRLISLALERHRDKQQLRTSLT